MAPSSTLESSLARRHLPDPFARVFDSLDEQYDLPRSTGIQQLCTAAGAFPCILDAAIFASFDRGQWNKENTESWRYNGA